MNETPLAAMNLLLAVPTYGPVDPLCQKDVRVGMMVASQYGVRWAGDASPDRVGFAAARNVVAQSLLSLPEATGIVWIDSDIRQKPTDMTRLLSSALHFNAEFVSGVYHQRAMPYDACFYEWRPKAKRFAALSDYPLDVFAPFDGCGFGFVYTSRKVIEGVARSKAFNPEKGWFPDERDSLGYGEDLSFCYQAMMAGFQLYVDTGIRLGHSGEQNVIYRDDALRLRPEGRVEETFAHAKWGIQDE